jgi:uncharacterized protein (TIGR02996 family)
VTERDVALAEIIANPDDDGPRLLFADWLEDHGEGRRAEFIRVQCELAKLDADDGESVADTTREVAGAWIVRAEQREALQRRERELFAVVVDGPLDVLPGTPIHAEPLGMSGRRQVDDATALFIYRRGFVEVAWLASDDFLRRAAALFLAYPIREVRLTDGVVDSTTVRPIERWGIPPHVVEALRAVVPDLLAEYGSRQDAEQALGNACVRYGRAKARPPLPWQ